jgi:capsular polysaccharide biosynthesis protein
MDLSLFLAVLWRSRRLMIVGVVLAAVLAVLAYGRPGISGGKPTLKPRGAEVWQSESQLLIAQAGFPYRQSAEATEPARSMGSLSPIYANLANGGLVQAEIRRQFGPTGSVKAQEDVDLAAATFLPFVTFTATAPAPGEATRLANGAASVFKAFVARQQAATGVPAARRIQLAVVEPGTNAKLVEGHKLSIPILVFVAILIGTIALILIRENLRLHAAAALGRVPSDIPSPEPLAEVAPVPLHARGGTHGATNGMHDRDPALHRDPVMSGDVRQ